MCKRCRVSRASSRHFTANSIQQPGTFIQDAHSAPSVKGKSRSVFKKRVISAKSTPESLPLKRKNKISTVCASEIDMCCKFQIQIICSKHDNKWYLRHSKDLKHNSHYGHLPVDNDHVDLSICHV